MLHNFRDLNTKWPKIKYDHKENRKTRNEKTRICSLKILGKDFQLQFEMELIVGEKIF